MNGKLEKTSLERAPKAFPFYYKLGLALCIFGVAMAAWSYTGYAGWGEGACNRRCESYAHVWVFFTECIASWMLWMGVAYGSQITPWKQITLIAASLVTLAFTVSLGEVLTWIAYAFI